MGGNPWGGVSGKPGYRPGLNCKEYAAVSFICGKQTSHSLPRTETGPARVCLKREQALASPELHIARVAARVRAGGHAIAEEKIRARWQSSVRNLIALLPYTTRVQVYDNSAQAHPGETIPDPGLLAQAEHGQLVWPHDTAHLSATPNWAKPILEAMLTGNRP